MFKPLASVVWGLVLTLCLPIAHAPAQNLQKLKVAEVVRSQLFAPMYVAINQSFFRDQGIELDLITANGGDRVGALVLSGQVDLGLAGPRLRSISTIAKRPTSPSYFAA